MIELLLIVAGVIIGWLSFPLIMFARARRDAAWDNSNMLNMYRVVAHIGAHPGDLALMQYADGKMPFYYIGNDELSDNMDVRPNDDAD